MDGWGGYEKNLNFSITMYNKYCLYRQFKFLTFHHFGVVNIKRNQNKYQFVIILPIQKQNQNDLQQNIYKSNLEYIKHDKFQEQKYNGSNIFCFTSFVKYIIEVKLILLLTIMKMTKLFLQYYIYE